MVTVVGTAQAADPAQTQFSDLLSLDFASMAALSQEDELEAPPPAIPDFGTKGSWRWAVQGGFAIDMDESKNTFVLLGGGFSYFMVDNLSLEIELNGMYISQVGDDAFAINFNLLGRWHFLVRDKWTLYGEVGAGLLGATETVPGPSLDDPRGGSHFEFTPQGGFGVTYEIKPQMRLVSGVRWHHISNARTNNSNPRRDSVLVYVGVSMPF